MANHKVVHIAHLLQDLTQHFNDVNTALSRAWLRHEMMRETLLHLTLICQETILQDEQNPS